MKEYHNKTHFKGATDIALFNQISSLSPSPSPKPNKLSKHMAKEKERDEFLGSLEADVVEKLPRPLKKDIIKKNPFLAKKYDTLSTEASDQDYALTILKTLSGHDSVFSSNGKKSVKFNFPGLVKEDAHYDVKKEEGGERIVVGDEQFLKSDINLITRKVLQKCNYFHSKNKNNNTRLRAGDGKLMFTSGMSISEFKEKYNFI